MVQHILRFIADYTKGTGRFAKDGACSSCGAELPAALEGNTCDTCNGVANFYGQKDLDPREVKDADYYRGHGAPADGVRFTWIHAFSDGCGVQFFCTVFWLFLSSFYVVFGLHVMWNYFCSCHGKTYGDGEGGAFKRAAESYENQDSSLSERRMTIRDAREFIEFGRRQLSVPTKDYYSKGGQGAIYRRYFHWLPTAGRSSVNRSYVKGAESGVCEFGTSVRIKMRSIRRVVSAGFEGVLYGSERPCCHSNCACMGGGADGVRKYSECNSSPFTKLRQLQLEPLSRTDPTPTRGAIALDGAQIGFDALVSEYVVFETEEEDDPFFVGQVTKKAAAPPVGYVVPDDLGFGFEFPRLKLALEVQLLRSAKTSRGESSACMYEVDFKAKPFLVPCHLLRVGKLRLQRVEVPSKRTRSGGAGPLFQFKLEASDRAIIYERCRIFD